MAGAGAGGATLGTTAGPHRCPASRLFDSRATAGHYLNIERNLQRGSFKSQFTAQARVWQPGLSQDGCAEMLVQGAATRQRTARYSPPYYPANSPHNDRPIACGGHTFSQGPVGQMLLLRCAARAHAGRRRCRPPYHDVLPSPRPLVSLRVRVRCARAMMPTGGAGAGAGGQNERECSAVAGRRGRLGDGLSKSQHAAHTRHRLSRRRCSPLQQPVVQRRRNTAAPLQPLRSPAGAPRSVAWPAGGWCKGECPNLRAE